MSIDLRQFGATLLMTVAALSVTAPKAMADEPLSAIDWLSQSLVTPVVQSTPVTNPDEPPVAANGGALPEGVAVSTLDQATPDAVGILPPRVTGLPENLWGLGNSADIAGLISAQNLTDFPALQSLFITLLLAEADAPAASSTGTDPSLLLTRIDKLLAMGALDQARALIDAAGPVGSADLFRRSFDVALLIGDENTACQTLTAAPDLSPALPTRIFCLARTGDWDTASLTLDAAATLGTVAPDEATLLARFLDPALDEGAALPAPATVTPLTLRIYEAVGEPLPTAALPIAFSYADLSDNTGWKAKIEAAERLARVGAIAPNVLLGLYTQQKPAASGSVWDRAAAFQKLDDAMTAQDATAVAQALPGAWAAMQSVELEVPFATLFAAGLAKLPLTGEAQRIAMSLALLSPDYESLTAAALPGASDGFVLGLARGDLTGASAADAMGRAIAPAFAAATTLPDDIKPLLDQHRTGEVILMAMARISSGAQGDLRGVTEGLTILRHIGLEDVARRTALELMLLERRG